MNRIWNEMQDGRDCYWEAKRQGLTIPIWKEHWEVFEETEKVEIQSIEETNLQPPIGGKIDGEAKGLGLGVWTKNQINKDCLNFCNKMQQTLTNQQKTGVVLKVHHNSVAQQAAVR